MDQVKAFTVKFTYRIWGDSNLHERTRIVLAYDEEHARNVFLRKSKALMDLEIIEVRRKRGGIQERT